MEGKTKVKKSNIANKSADYQMRIDRRMERRPRYEKIYVHRYSQNIHCVRSKSETRQPRVAHIYISPEIRVLRYIDTPSDIYVFIM